jgi:hypothetical protein
MKDIIQFLPSTDGKNTMSPVRTDRGGCYVTKAGSLSFTLERGGCEPVKRFTINGFRIVRNY